MTREDLEAAFEGEPALVAYVAAGDPSIEDTKEYVKALVRGGADVVELGLPFSEPIAEGPTIQAAVRRSLGAGMTVEKYLDLVRDLREEDVDVPIVCMTYYNLIYQYGEEGPDDFVEAAADAGVDGFVVPDLPVDESGPMHDACEANDLALVSMVAPTTTEERLDRMLEQASGFVYVQARLGTTGAQADVSEQTHEGLERVGETDVPKAVGFGIASGEQAKEVVEGGADGVIVGSAFIDIIEEGVESDEDVDVAARLESKARELKEGAVEGMPRPERT
ncbi:tryptophan synthase subunit alpha [Halospeciosus flavus]|uniref:Tryptophan synthase alpha chain n=1 Tax=Halospeciosus flavus TaxID=3032283 RepID=A0ABD5Z5T6_9EURY|nr:tryptophan synthase subunit alpha [Halospeciosus flavus]